MSTTTPTGLIVPANTDILSAEQAFSQYALGADLQAIPRFTSLSARNAAFSGRAVAGQLNMLTAAPAAELYMWDGTSHHGLEDERVAFSSTNTSVTNSTTYVTVTGLSISLPIGGRFAGEAFLSVRSDFTSKFKFRIHPSGGVSGASCVTIAASGANTVNPGNAFVSANYADSDIVVGAPNVAGSTSIRVQFNAAHSAVGQSISVQFAQSVASAATTTVFTGSFMTIRRIGD